VYLLDTSDLKLDSAPIRATLTISTPAQKSSELAVEWPQLRGYFLITLNEFEGDPEELISLLKETSAGSQRVTRATAAKNQVPYLLRFSTD
jgi:hypothetical protein